MPPGPERDTAANQWQRAAAAAKAYAGEPSFFDEWLTLLRSERDRIVAMPEGPDRDREWALFEVDVEDAKRFADDLLGDN